jgi:hypothetical protein
VPYNYLIKLKKKKPINLWKKEKIFLGTNVHENKKKNKAQK